MKRAISIIFFITAVISAAAQDYVFNRYPLAETDYAELPIGAIKAEGWLHDQLVRQKDGTLTRAQCAYLSGQEEARIIETVEKRYGSPKFFCTY